MHYRISEVRDRNIDELIGISRGLIADDSVNQKEAEFLHEWILNHFDEYGIDQYPQNIIYDRLSIMLSDGILDNDESKELLDLLKNLTGGRPIANEIKSMTAELPLCKPAPDVLFEDKIFCFTGEFTIGTRKVCENIVKDKGGGIKKQPTLKTDYLVVGILGSEDWIHSSFGRKIEAAVNLRDERKTGIKIISEEHFIKFIDD